MYPVLSVYALLFPGCTQCLDMLSTKITFWFQFRLNMFVYIGNSEDNILSTTNVSQWSYFPEYVELNFSSWQKLKEQQREMLQ